MAWESLGVTLSMTDSANFAVGGSKVERASKTNTWPHLNKSKRGNKGFESAAAASTAVAAAAAAAAAAIEMKEERKRLRKRRV